MTLHFILVLLSIIFFALAGLGYGSPPAIARLHLGWIGLALFAGSFLP